MSFFCPHCNSENGAGEIWQGMKMRCPACLREMTLTWDIQKGPNKASDSYDGYAVSYFQFCVLLQNEVSRQKIKPVVEKILNCTMEAYNDPRQNEPSEAEKLLNCSIEGSNSPFVLKRNGALIPLEVAHLLIQFDPVKQRTFYNIAMSIWHGS